MSSDIKIPVLTCEYLLLQHETEQILKHFEENKGYITLDDLIDINRNVHKINKILKQFQKSYLIQHIHNTD